MGILLYVAHLVIGANTVDEASTFTGDWNVNTDAGMNLQK